MALKGRESHFFLGANTPKGFYSYYDYLISQKSARKIYCIKGGPGTGKSTFMKKIAGEVIKKGADVEYAHCSSDPDSLDGIIIKPCNIAFVDGTSPHIVDPKTPGAVDTILHLGSCWRSEEIARHKEAIMRTKSKISECFEFAYRHLGAARLLQENIDETSRKSLNGNAHSLFLEDIMFKEFAEIPVSHTRGDVRKLFASGITPKGIINFSDTVLKGYKTYILKGYCGKCLDEICNIAVSRGFDAECYYCPFYPDEKIDYLLIPKLNLAFSVSNKYHSFEDGDVVDFNEFASKYMLETYREERAFSQNQVDALINHAVESIQKAKKYHDELEQYYIPAMDFEKIDMLFEKTMQEVLEFI